MADLINIGTSPNDGTGDDLRTAFNKVNSNYPINVVEINDLDDLPTPISGVISLVDGYTYRINKNLLDLAGNRISADNAVVNLYGNSSETSYLTSTGLGVGVPLITSNTTIKLGNLTIQDVDTGISLNKNTVMALDWVGVNFLNIPNLWNIVDFDNMILNMCTISNCNNGKFTGEFGTFAITESPLIGNGSLGSVLDFESTVVCTRRIRIEQCPIVAFGSTNGVTVDNGITLGTDQFILRTNNFSGGGTYLGGIDYTDVRTNFKNNKGIFNTYKGGLMKLTTQAQTVLTVNVWSDVAGTFTISKNQHTDSPLNGHIRALDNDTVDYKLTSRFVFDGSPNDVLELRASIWRNATSTFEPQDIFTESITNSQGGNDYAEFNCFDDFMLNENDYVKYEIRNITDNSNVTALVDRCRFMLEER